MRESNRRWRTLTHQTSFSQAEFADKKKITRREKVFLARMEAIIPWADLLAVIEPFYPKGGVAVRPSGWNRMLRSVFPATWYGLADEALEDAIYDSQALRGFARIDLAADGVPDATTLLKFRRLLETNVPVQRDLQRHQTRISAGRGLLLREGTPWWTPRFCSRPPSTKNRERQRGPEMHQTRKGNQWYFRDEGAHRRGSGTANWCIRWSSPPPPTRGGHHEDGGVVARPGDAEVHADAGYTGVEKREEITALNRTIDWQNLRCKRGLELKKLGKKARRRNCSRLGLEQAKASVRAFVGHPFHIASRSLFRHRKELRYLRGWRKKRPSTPHPLRTGQPGHWSETGNSVKIRADTRKTE